jgi:flagellar basal-body rod protein FlgF
MNAMENTSYIALSRETALWRKLETVANNLANQNTPAFKSEHMMFIEQLKVTNGGQSLSEGRMSFVQDHAMFRNTAEGPLTPTDNPLDMAIHGQGYFVVDTPDGPRYSRSGHFRLDEAGQMVTTDGYPVLSTRDQPFFFAPTETKITVSRDGSISTENGLVGRLRVVRFDNEHEMRKVSGGLYTSAATPNDVEKPDVAQGMLEGSNVQPVVEITTMIELMRSYQAMTKMLDTEHERQRKAMDVLARTQR